jgi:predicted alpha/beta hydrolase family esterase
MARCVLFLQGGGEGAHVVDERLASNLRQALGPDYQVRYPTVPDEGSPTYAAWKAILERELPAMGEDAILVGHSLGAAMLIRFLVEHQPHRKIAGVFLISTPFVGEGGWPGGEDELPKGFAAKVPEGVPLFFYQGQEDQTVPVAHVDLFAKALPQATVRRLEGRDHQLNEDLSEVADDIRALGERRRAVGPSRHFRLSAAGDRARP